MTTGQHLEVTLLHAEGVEDRAALGSVHCKLSTELAKHSCVSNSHCDPKLDPVWNQVLTFLDVKHEETLLIKMYSSRGIFRARFVGGCKLLLRQVACVGTQDVRLALHHKNGTATGAFLHLRLIHRTGPLSPSAVGVISTHQAASRPTPGFKIRDKMQHSCLGRSVTPPRGAAVGPAAKRRSASPLPAGGACAPVPQTQAILPPYAHADCWAVYRRGAVLGQGSSGTTYLAVDRRTDEQVAIKSIEKSRLRKASEVDDVRREVQVMHHLAGSPHVPALRGVYEDAAHVHLAMQLCVGGDLYSYVRARGRVGEARAAALLRGVVRAVAHCHGMGVTHRDVKLENFLLSDAAAPDANVLVTDFGISTFFHEGQVLTDKVGTAFYIAPEVLGRWAGKEADIWACGVVLYIMLSGRPPFNGKTRAQVFERVCEGPVDLESEPWDTISEPAKDLLLRMLYREPSRRATAAEVLAHPWVRENGGKAAAATLPPLETVERLRRFGRRDALQKHVAKVIGGMLPADETAGLRSLFLEIDKDRSGCVTLHELGVALRRKGHASTHQELAALMQGVDQNGDGVLDWSEFLAAMLHRGKLLQEARLKAAFAQLDADGDGALSRDDLATALKRWGLAEGAVDALLTAADGDGDGRVSLSDFMCFMRAPGEDEEVMP